ITFISSKIRSKNGKNRHEGEKTKKKPHKTPTNDINSAISIRDAYFNKKSARQYAYLRTCHSIRE
ncbi:MAG: hypothetical protein ACRDC9_12295, partial [Plesiomonas shigelloides]